MVFKGTHEAILEKQTTFDALAERAQTLLQSTTDNRVTSQLTQLSARYTTLMSASKVLTLKQILLIINLNDRMY